MRIKHILLIGLISVLSIAISGCSFLSSLQKKISQGSVSSPNWYISKIIIDDKEYLAPQILAKNAQKELDINLSADIKDSKSPNQQLKNTQTQQEVTHLQAAQSTDSITRIEQAQDIKNNQDQNESSPPEELAKIKGVASLDFDTKQNIISGTSGCSSYFVHFSWENKHTIQVIPGAFTRKVCHPNEIMRFDFRLLRGLEGIFKVVQENNKSLLLKGEHITIVLYRE